MTQLVAILLTILAFGKTTFLEQYGNCNDVHQVKVVEVVSGEAEHHPSDLHHSNDGASECEHNEHHCHAHCVYIIPQFKADPGAAVVSVIPSISKESEPHVGVYSRILRPPLLSA